MRDASAHTMVCFTHISNFGIRVCGSLCPTCGTYCTYGLKVLLFPPNAPSMCGSIGQYHCQRFGLRSSPQLCILDLYDIFTLM